jgi:hypothetical protein
MTLSAAPLASITVRPEEARPVGRDEQRAAVGPRRGRQAVDQHGERLDAAGDLQRQRIGLAVEAR